MPMPLNAQVAEALNQQVNNELKASHVYRAMAAYFDAQELPGFASWFRGHADEEVGHAMRLYDHLVKRDARVELTGIDQPSKDYSSAEAVHESKEYGTQPVLHWFLEEQVEEEDLFRRLLDQVKATEDSRWHLLMLDQELAGRQGA